MADINQAMEKAKQNTAVEKPVYINLATKYELREAFRDVCTANGLSLTSVLNAFMELSVSEAKAEGVE